MQTVAHDIDEKTRTKDVILQENVSFESLFISANVKKGLADGGFKKPSPIQFKTIPLGRCGFDLIVKSKSGTGKTLVFSIIALETVNSSKDYLQVLILAPTREIAVQIQDVIKCVGCHIEGLSVHSFIGGLPLEEDIKKAKQCHIAVGAPGRVKHLINIGSLCPKNVKLFVLDEADKLFDVAFQKDINEIYDSLPQRKQLIATSATYPNELDTFLSNYMHSPTHITSENETPLLLGLKQFVAILKAGAINAAQQMKAKNEILLDILSKVSFTQCLVFTNYQTRTESVCNFLNQKGWTASFISAAVDQNSRLEAISDLKNFKSRILLSTDLTSRGIDAPNVDLVINYDLPNDAATYLHRMGRAGRYGSSGICINFALEGQEIEKLQLILGVIGGTKLSISKLPSLKDIDLWQIDTNSLDIIWGVVPSETFNEISKKIKKEVLTLKQNKREKSRCKDRKGGKKKMKLEEIEKADCVEQLLKMKKEEVESCESNEDGEDILNSLINDEDSKKRKRISSNEKPIEKEKQEQILTIKKQEDENDDSERLLYSLIKQEENIPQINSSIKDSKDTTLCKNKALLSITKLVTNSGGVEDDLIASIGSHLSILKEENVEQLSEDSNIVAISSLKKEDIEDIFKFGYECAIKNREGGWLESLSSEELDSFRAFCRKDQVIISSESEEDEDYEMEDEEEDIEEDEEIEESPDLALQWQPVVRNENPNEVASTSNHFERCFEDCSTVLWNTGLTFETVSNFDNWFYQWQEQLQSVRNYAQQNIYVEEMSRYQQSRLTMSHTHK